MMYKYIVNICINIWYIVWFMMPQYCSITFFMNKGCIITLCCAFSKSRVWMSLDARCQHYRQHWRKLKIASWKDQRSTRQRGGYPCRLDRRQKCDISSAKYPYFDRCLSHQDWWVMLGVLLLWQGETHPCRWAVQNASQKCCREGRDDAKNSKLLVTKGTLSYLRHVSWFFCWFQLIRVIFIQCEFDVAHTVHQGHTEQGCDGVTCCVEAGPCMGFRRSRAAAGNWALTVALGCWLEKG